MVGCILANFLEFSNFFESFHTNMAQNHPQLQILPKKLIRLGQNDQIWLFCTIFYHPIHNFSHLLPPKHIIFGEISKFSFLGGVHRQIFWVFQLFQIILHQYWLKMTHNCKFGQKSGLDWVKTAIFAYFSIFSPKMRLRLTGNCQFHLIHNFSHLLPPKHLIFGEISKIFVSGGGTSANFLSFPTFSNHFTPMWLKMTHNGKFGQKSGLDWVKMAIFAYFSIFSPKMRLRLTRNGQFHLIHNFSHLLPPKHIIFGEISKIFISGGGTSANFLSRLHSS